MCIQSKGFLKLTMEKPRFTCEASLEFAHVCWPKSFAGLVSGKNSFWYCSILLLLSYQLLVLEGEAPGEMHEGQPLF